MAVLRYKPPLTPAHFALVTDEGTPKERCFPFCDRIEIGRLETEMAAPEAMLLVEDPTVSAHHCQVFLGADGRLLVRDTSRNGTRLDGRRLLPNRETELRPGQVLTIGARTRLRLRESDLTPVYPGVFPRTGTMASPCSERISVVVGDIRGYTGLLGSAPRERIQDAVSGVFARLEEVVHEMGGEIKEYQGDSLLAFWEGLNAVSPAAPACHAALALHERVRELAGDRALWPFSEHPLYMDWAVATGPVSLRVLGADRPEELSIVGEPIVLAYRMEKLADQDTGPLLVCGRTREEAGDAFEYKELGARLLPGFDHAVHVSCLIRERPKHARAPAGGQLP